MSFFDPWFGPKTTTLETVSKLYARHGLPTIQSLVALERDEKAKLVIAVEAARNDASAAHTNNDDVYEKAVAAAKATYELNEKAAGKLDKAVEAKQAELTAVEAQVAAFETLLPAAKA